MQLPERLRGDLDQAVLRLAAGHEWDIEIRVIAETERQREPVGVLHRGLNAEPSWKQPVGDTQQEISGPGRVCIWVFPRQQELAGHPGTGRVGTMLAKPPRPATDEAMDRVLARGISERQREAPAVPGE